MPRRDRIRTPAQNRQIWSLVTKIWKRCPGASQDDIIDLMRRHCEEIADHRHTSRLTPRQADALIARLETELQTRGETPAERRARTAAQARPTREQRPGRAGQPITPRQQRLIQQLFAQIGWDARAQQMAFCRRQTGQPWPQTQSDADRVIEPLKDMALRDVVPRVAWTRAKAIRNHTALDAWKRGFIADLIRQFDEADRGGRLDVVLTTHKLAKLLECEAACGITP